MKIVVLSTNPKLYSTSRLLEAGKERGHKMVVLNHRRCYMNITSHRPGIHYKGEELSGFDAVIPRIGASVTFYGTAVLRQFEMMNVFPLNESVAITRSRDKLRSAQLLARKGVGMPVTGFAHCALMDYWNQKTGKTQLKAYQASRRGGELELEKHDDRVLIKGKAVVVYQAEMELKNE